MSPPPEKKEPTKEPLRAVEPASVIEPENRFGLARTGSELDPEPAAKLLTARVKLAVSKLVMVPVEDDGLAKLNVSAKSPIA